MAELKLNRSFNPERKRHYLNGELTVLHCHHYSTLYTQLALDAKETELLKSVSEESFHKVLITYFEENNLDSIEEKTEAAVEYFATMGLGKLELSFIGTFSGEVTLPNSHVDEGWIKKWGEYDRPVNYIGCGYVTAMFSAILNKPLGYFDAVETKSIVMGDDESRIKVLVK